MKYVKNILYTILVSAISIIVVLAIIRYQETQEKLINFASVGGRFTSLNGQQLCVRVQDLEKAVGISPKPCEYYIEGNVDSPLSK